jgi:hypothetical protein
MTNLSDSAWFKDPNLEVTKSGSTGVTDIQTFKLTVPQSTPGDKKEGEGE